jgi:hypothetical protein
MTPSTMNLRIVFASALSCLHHTLTIENTARQ